MKGLKKENWPIYLILNILTLGFYTFYIAYRLDLYEKDAWYHRWYYWVLGFICGIIPGILMFLIFSVKIGCLVSAKLKVPGDEIYSFPYAWILCTIVPILGWVLFIILYVYVHIWYVFKIKNEL